MFLKVSKIFSFRGGVESLAVPAGRGLVGRGFGVGGGELHHEAATKVSGQGRLHEMGMPTQRKTYRAKLSG